ncbi:MAG: DUF2752 domain-containing protein [Elusimicrobiaceae bacterium]
MNPAKRMMIKKIDKKYFLLPGLFLAGWIYYPYCFTGPRFCLWHQLTGHDCWGCGLTRAICSMAHFHIRDAVNYNPLALALVTLIATDHFNDWWKYKIRNKGKTKWQN